MNHKTFSREDKLVERAKALKVNSGTEPDADLGPVISKQVLIIFLPYILNFYFSYIIMPLNVPRWYLCET